MNASTTSTGEFHQAVSDSDPFSAFRSENDEAVARGPVRAPAPASVDRREASPAPAFPTASNPQSEPSREGLASARAGFRAVVLLGVAVAGYLGYGYWQRTGFEPLLSFAERRLSPVAPAPRTSSVTAGGGQRLGKEETAPGPTEAAAAARRTEGGAQPRTGRPATGPSRPSAGPTGLLFVNARPWADVWIDGKPAGTTPLANLRVSPGTHDILWKHPLLGERRQQVTVTLESPTRIGMNLQQ